ncbi:MAG: hypothetical protein P3A28_01390 [Gemmatimonadota bacterium]|nr:hypothetical protein [Gemmatimonadota bacterium]
MSGHAPDRALLVRLVHLSLFMGTTLVGVVMFMLRARMDPPPTVDLTLGLALAGVAVLGIAIALTQLRQRVTPRGSSQSPADYWGDARIRLAAMIFWAVLEGAGLLSVVAYYLSGSPIPLGVAILSVIVGFVMRPAVLEG